MRNSIPQLSNNKQQMLKEGVFTFNFTIALIETNLRRKRS